MNELFNKLLEVIVKEGRHSKAMTNSNFKSPSKNITLTATNNNAGTTSNNTDNTQDKKKDKKGCC
jgi:hypothetical protein